MWCHFFGGCTVTQRDVLCTCIISQKRCVQIGGQICFCNVNEYIKRTDSTKKSKLGIALLQRECSQKMISPVTDNKLNAGLCCSFEDLVGLINTPPRTVLAINLKNLVPKAQPSQSGWGVGLHQLDKHSLKCRDSSANTNKPKETREWMPRRLRPQGREEQTSCVNYYLECK